MSVTTTCVGADTTSFSPRLRLPTAPPSCLRGCPKPSATPPPPATTFSSACQGAFWKNPLFAKTKPSKGPPIGAARAGRIGPSEGANLRFAGRGPQPQPRIRNRIHVEAVRENKRAKGTGRATTRGASARRRRHEAHRRHRVHHRRGDRGCRAGGPVRRGAGALPGRVRQPGNLGERLRLSLGLPEQGVLVRWRARRPRGGGGRDRDHVRDCLLRRRSRGHARVGRRAGDEGTEAPRSFFHAGNSARQHPSATIFFFREPRIDPPVPPPSLPPLHRPRNRARTTSPCPWNPR